MNVYEVCLFEVLFFKKRLTWRSPISPFSPPFAYGPIGRVASPDAMAPLGDEVRCEAKPRHYRYLYSILLPDCSPDHSILYSRLSTAVSIAKATLLNSSSLQYNGIVQKSS